MKPLNAYMPFKDFSVGNFFLMRPHDLDLVLIWMGRTKVDVVKDEKNEYFKMV